MPKTKTRWVRVPVPPTKEMLEGMAAATFLSDRSDLEMERRFNGMIDNLPKRKKTRKSKTKNSLQGLQKSMVAGHFAHL